MTEYKLESSGGINVAHLEEQKQGDMLNGNKIVKKKR